MDSALDALLSAAPCGDRVRLILRAARLATAEQLAMLPTTSPEQFGADLVALAGLMASDFSEEAADVRLASRFYALASVRLPSLAAEAAHSLAIHSDFVATPERVPPPARPLST